ncbi:MAG: succinate-semialdehyde dehydrogenase/glutarate-semialdehyde dehydrogenase [Verrucomicrobiales bacterium]|jgi:succinate-semialdehyde dehydrogenase/glutarate-semialdehyde dehydrogenase
MVLKLNDPSLEISQAYIDGSWIDADSGNTFDVIDPVDGSIVGSVADLGVDETRRAIEAAEAAMPAWAGLTAKQRGAIMRTWFNLLIENQEDLAQLMTAEMGKPIRESRGEAVFAANFVDWFAEQGKRAYGEIIPTHDNSKRLMVLRQPIGVVAAVTPWNFPMAMITRKIAPAMAAGCASVLKPAQDCPMTALAVAALAERAGVPAGILNIVTSLDPVAIGLELSTNPIIKKISFTGSTAVGKLLMAQASGTVKAVSMELGGNAPFIVFDDADIDEAVEGAIASKYRNTGQTCICANRMFVQDGVYDEFSAKFAERASQLAVGAAAEDATEIGPLVNVAALEKVSALVGDALSDGATALTGGAPHELGGTYYQVTVLGDVTTDMRLFSEEIFGPVAPLYRFSTEEEAIQMANDTPFGLASYFYAGDLARIWRVSEGLDYGMVGVNTGLISTEIHPFGGMKESGIGREGSHNGLDEYLETKYVCLGGI